MNLDELFSKASQKFIREHLSSPIEDLLLRAKKFPDLNIPLLVAQIDGIQKAKKKLPSWSAHPGIVYPVKISMEQCSSEVTANYKATLVNGDRLLDLTGGFGVDSFAFSKKIKEVFYVERNETLAKVAAHNFKTLEAHGIRVFNQQAEEFLAGHLSKIDWIFIDPARRKEGSKVVLFADCEPNVVALKHQLFLLADSILIKTSPLLDIEQAAKELGEVSEVHVVAVENECKELLFLLSKNRPMPSSGLKITAVNLKKNTFEESFSFTKDEESTASIALSSPLTYLYEPNAALLKAGAFKIIGNRFGLTKLNPNSHLYTSSMLVENFPGRSFKIIASLKYGKKELTAAIPLGKANITVRNFPDSVETIRKKTGIKDGGDSYLFATRDPNDKPIVLLTEKIQ